MLNLPELIREHNTGDPDDTAEAVFEAIHLPSRFRPTLAPLLRDECRRHQRAAVRWIERGGTPGQATEHTSPMAMPPAGRGSLLDKHFYTGIGYVTWGAATVTDHEGRIAFLLSLRNGVDTTIDRHRKALADIEAAGVACLNDIPVADGEVAA